MNETRRDDLASDLAMLASAMEALSIPDPTERPRLGGRRDWVVRTIRGYLIPRLEDPTSPLTVVFAGPTGAGKSTLLNSVAGAEHSLAGPLRPTTKTPVVLTSGSRASKYDEIGGVHCEVVTGRARILGELTLVDTPDVDSTSTEHRVIAETMIDNADIVVYVTSALRYSDLVPWEVLRRAHSRGVPVVHVLNRLKSSAAGAMADYRSRLQKERLDSDVVPVHEHHLGNGGQIVPSVAVEELRDRLVEIVKSRRAGEADVVGSVLHTTLDQVDELTLEVATIANESSEAVSRVRDIMSMDLDRVAARVEIRDSPAIDLRPLEDLAVKRVTTRSIVRGRLPGSSEVAMAQTLLDAALVFAIDTDFRRRLETTGVIHGVILDRLMTDTHTAAVAAIAAWKKDVAGLELVSAAPDPELASLLIGHACLAKGESRLIDVLEVVIGAEVSMTVTSARDRLSLHLLPVYSSVEHRVTSRIAMGVTPESAIEGARSAMSAVIARSSFANA